MKSKFLRFGALALALLMTVAVAGCGKADTESTGSEEYEYEYEYVYESDDTTAESSADADAPANSTADDKTSTTSKNNGKNDKVTTVNDGVNPADYKGKTVTYATWRDPAVYEDGPVIKKFEKKYDIKVKADIITESGYTNTVIGRIAADTAPDVFFCTYTFPACIDALQPITNAKINLNESFWDKEMTKLGTVNGNAYLVNSVGNIWNDRDIVFYNKRLFAQNNITTPEEYIAQGKWTFDAMKKCMQDVAALGTKYVGGAVNFPALVTSTGASYITYKDGKFSNTSDSPMLDKVATWVTEGVSGGWIKGTTLTQGINFKTGNYGIFVGQLFGLKANGYFRDMNPDDIGFVPIPDFDANTKAVPTTFVRGWGICEKAKEPVAAGIFLRYYLDVDNYNTTKAFISSEAETFFFNETAKTDGLNYYLNYGEGTQNVTGTTNTDYFKCLTGAPEQVVAFNDSIQNTINSDVKKLNDFISKVNS